MARTDLTLLTDFYQLHTAMARRFLMSMIHLTTELKRHIPMAMFIREAGFKVSVADTVYIHGVTEENTRETSKTA